MKDHGSGKTIPSRESACRTSSTHALPLALLLPALVGGCAPEPAPVEAELDVERYELTGAFDWDAQRLDATVRITFRGAGDHVEFDSAVEAIGAVRGPSGEALAFDVDTEAQRLRIELPERSGDAFSVSIDYQAAAGENLRAIPPRAGDPVPIRALFTHSEPRGAHAWMPCNDRPDDRARFAIQMRTAPEETMISNGALARDESDAEGRVVGYEMSVPIPTYLMAFAITQFEVESSDQGSVPVSVWHRPGVPGSYGAQLEELSREIALFEGLLGPYPFDEYRLVLLPDIPGMENAGITFQNEARSAEPDVLADLRLTAHELAHQWAGDLTTVATWQDVWIKEGLATLLEVEAMRPFEDQSHAGTLFGDWLYGEEGVPVIDPRRAPEDKYTSGIYYRAAWVWTQIRAVVGEEVFWQTLRDLLERHRFGAVGTGDVLGAFAPHLGPVATARTVLALHAGGLPYWEYSLEGADVGRLIVHDPDGVLIAPFEVEWLRADGTRERLSTAEDGSIRLERKDAGDLLVIDPRDVHPPLSTWLWANGDTFDDEAQGPLLFELTGGEPEAAARLGDLPGAHQAEALENAYYGYWPIPPEGFPDLWASLHAESARAVALDEACGALPYSDAPETWGAMVAEILADDPPVLGADWTRRQCASVPEVEALFAPEWEALAAGSVPPDMSLGRLYYLARTTYPPGSEYDLWSTLAKEASSVRVRALSAWRIRVLAGKTAGDPAAEAPARALVLELLESNETAEVLREMIPATRVYHSYPDPSGSADMIAALVKILRSPSTLTVHWRAVCAAHYLIGEDLPLWQAFVEDLDGAPLSHDASYRLAHPLECL